MSISRYSDTGGESGSTQADTTAWELRVQWSSEMNEPKGDIRTLAELVEVQKLSS